MSDQRYYRRVFRWRAEDSPNVRLALSQRRVGFVEVEEGRRVLAPMPQGGKIPTGEIVIPGVLSWQEYCDRRTNWDPQRQCVGLDAMFYTGPEQLLFPPTWLARAGSLTTNGKAEAIGVDPGEGMANTAWSIVNKTGLIDLISYRTPDTTEIVNRTVALMIQYNVVPEMVVFDRGGGGYQLACQLRSAGKRVRTVAFGEVLSPMPKRGLVLTEEKIETREEKTSYVNRRAEMYGELSNLCDPSQNPQGFSIPARFTELHRQLGKMPKLYDVEGRMYMLPKNKKPTMREDKQGADQDTLVGLLGRSPDEADSLAVAVWGMLNRAKPKVLGRMF